jgi:hypothetical protein
MRYFLASLVAFATLSADRDPGLISGMGALNCSALTEQLVPGQGYAQSKLSVAVFSWVQGFSSALNAIGIVQNGHFFDLRSINEDEQWSHIVKFCQQNPDGLVFEAVRDMIATRFKIENGPPSPLTR